MGASIAVNQRRQGALSAIVWGTLAVVFLGVTVMRVEHWMAIHVAAWAVALVVMWFVIRKEGK